MNAHRKTRTPEIPPGPAFLPAWTTAAFVTIALIVVVVSASSFAESYHGLLEWAVRHDEHGVWAAGWPLQIDSFIVIGELALFGAMTSRWPRRVKSPFWFVACIGLLISVGGDVGHVAGTATLPDRLTAAVPPLAAFAALAVGMVVVKQLVTASAQPLASASFPIPATVAADVLTAAKAAYLASVAGNNPLSVRQIADRFGISRPQAAKVIASSNVDQQAIEAARP